MSYALSSGRRMAESRMTDACTVSRVGEPVLDEDTGEMVGTVVAVYTGPCRVKHPSTGARDVEAGSQLLVVGQLELHVPVGTPVFAADDVVVITASETRADQVGREFTVVGPFDGSQTTALRYRIEVADGR